MGVGLHSAVPSLQLCLWYSWTGFRGGRGEERLQFRHLKILSLLFPDGVVLMAPSTLQQLLGRFNAECESAGIRTRTFKSNAMVLSRNQMDCLLQVGHESLLQVKEFRYLLFTSEGMTHLEFGELEQQVWFSSICYVLMWVIVSCCLILAVDFHALAWAFEFPILSWSSNIHATYQQK